MTTATAEKSTSTRELTGADVVDAARWYELYEIEARLSIPVGIVAAAVRGEHNRPGCVRYFRDARGVGSERCALLGADVLNWVERETIEYAVTDSAAEMYHRLQRIHNPPEPEPTPKTADDHVEDRLAEWRRNEQCDADIHSTTASARYVQLLKRGDDLTETEVAELAAICTDFSITKDQRHDDRARINKAQELRKLDDARDAALEALSAANETYSDMEVRHREEERRLFHAKLAAGNYQNATSQAAGKLQTLRRERGFLFVQASEDELPRLAGDEC